MFEKKPLIELPALAIGASTSVEDDEVDAVSVDGARLLTGAGAGGV